MIHITNQHCQDIVNNLLKIFCIINLNMGISDKITANSVMFNHRFVAYWYWTGILHLHSISYLIKGHLIDGYQSSM
jgi:hypothetical protein